MDVDFAAVVGLIGGSFTVLTVMMKLRDDLDDRRNMLLGLKENGARIQKELRLYILDKDIRERWLAMIVLMMSTGLILTGAAIYERVVFKKMDLYLTLVFAGSGALCLVACVVIWYVGYKDYHLLREYIQTGKWRGIELAPRA